MADHILMNYFWCYVERSHYAPENTALDILVPFCRLPYEFGAILTEQLFFLLAANLNLKSLGCQYELFHEGYLQI